MIKMEREEEERKEITIKNHDYLSIDLLYILVSRPPPKTVRGRTAGLAAGLWDAFGCGTLLVYNIASHYQWESQRGVEEVGTKPDHNLNPNPRPQL